jgi:hypothetical protein
MTAIAAGKTPSAVIIAADGRTRLDDETRSCHPELLARETESARKIFEIDRQDAKLAFAMAGWLLNDDITFDLREEGVKSAHRLAATRFDSFAAYAAALAEELAASVNRARHFPAFDHVSYGRGWIIADLILVGYFRSQQWIASFMLKHEGRECEPSPLITYDDPILYGSGLVAHDMYIRDAHFAPRPLSQFSEYQVRLGGPPSPEEMQDFCVRYISACKCDLARRRDSRCNLIGGHIHVLEIKEGSFHWRIPPIMAQSTHSAVPLTLWFLPMFRA